MYKSQTSELNVHLTNLRKHLKLHSQQMQCNDFIFWQSDTKLCWGNEKMVGEMQQFVGEMQYFVGETKQFVGEMKQICWGNEANGWGNEAKCVGEMPRR